MRQRRIAYKLTLMFLVNLSVVFQAISQTLSVSSPDSAVVFTLQTTQDDLLYSVKFNNAPLIQASRLGLRFADSPDFAGRLSVSEVERNTVENTWEQPWGEARFIREHFNELLVKFDNAGINLRVRVFNDGIGFRYEGAGKGIAPISIMDDLTEFNFAQWQQAKAWWIPAQSWNRYEYQYSQTGFDKIKRVHTPVTLKLNENAYVAIHEAALIDFAAMYLEQRRPGVLKSMLVPRADGTKVKAKPDFVSSWRTIQVAKKPTGLVNSRLILNLNEPNKLGDVSWVQPGKYVGIWWGMHLGKYTWGTDGEHGATTARTKQYMDFAAEHGFDGVLVEGWNKGWDGEWFNNGDVFSFTQSYPDFDLKEVTEYGARKGVRLIGHHETSGSISNYEKQMEEAYALYAKHGVRQVKTGYVADGGQTKWEQDGKTVFQWHDSQPMVNHYLRSIQLAAKYKISINTHEPIKDTGLRRTYPNWLTREGARGQEFNAWGSPPNSPEHTAILPFTRLLAGPMDFTPGIVNLAFNGLDAENRVRTTLAKQLSLYVVLYSPVHMAADLPEHYEKQMQALEFIKAVPTDWEKSIALAGGVGEYIVMARQQRGTDLWFVGALTNESERTVTLDFSFLPNNKAFQATIYQDTKEANWRSNPYALEVIKRRVDSQTKLIQFLASSGGVAIKLEPLQ
ncbi:glycoside hydrolase family 97 protein [Alteromonas ponticola]|uniref:Glycoside hydrolase family 97 protein n=1 Tax=Alteromonas aquimaris TaxID=2998417 RepID=A0ABT3P709_9ALTE|nr:glycoside hydrolase family 97 protein [Alteromonas aquimaris]MCW8108539.1 glycoside hydrolase family 97 protein [Alteromonas aquimaris]